MNVSLFLEIKEEYTNHLIDTITPFIYEGLTSIYKAAVDTATKAGDDKKILLVFQKMLQTVNDWGHQRIEDEALRIKTMSNTAGYLDDLIKAVIKSNIILLSYSNTISNIIGQAFYDNFTTGMFIHRCYTECAKDAHNNPYLFYHDVSPMDVKRNQIIIQQNIESSVVRAIRKVLPISMILKEYLVNSINIIDEPAKVELVGVPPVAEKRSERKSEKPKVDPVVEKELIRSIKSEQNKTENDKIKQIMQMDKILGSINKVSEGRISDVYQVVSSIPAQYGSASDKVINRHLHKSDQMLMDINFGGSSARPEKTHTSNLSFSMAPMANMKMAPLTSEINPNEAEFIEEYGGGRPRRHRK